LRRIKSETGNTAYDECKGAGIVLNLSVFMLVVPLVAGIILGYFLREKRKIDLGKVTIGAIVALIFSLGFGIGSNSELLGSLPRVALNAIVIAGLAIVFSVLFVVVARRKVGLE
jgi:hypothetical protein